MRVPVVVDVSVPVDDDEVVVVSDGPPVVVVVLVLLLPVAKGLPVVVVVLGKPVPVAVPAPVVVDDETHWARPALWAWRSSSVSQLESRQLTAALAMSLWDVQAQVAASVESPQTDSIAVVRQGTWGGGCC